MTTIDDFKSVVRHLFLNNDIKQFEFHKIIKEVLKDCVKDLPPTRVMYNACHGGFDYSDDFEKFVGDYIYGERETTVKHIIPFAEHILATQDTSLLRILYIYNKYNMKTIFSHIYCIHSKRKDNICIAMNMEKLRNYTRYVCPSKPQMFLSDYFFMTTSNLDISKYDPVKVIEIKQQNKGKAYLDKNNEEINKAIIKIKELYDNADIDDMVAFYNDFNKDDGYCGKEERLTFVENLKKLGYKNKKTWEHQSHYCINAIMYIIENYSRFEAENIEVNEDIMHSVKERFGLLCASDKYAQLAIYDVPAKLDYKINEYDGLEGVVVL